MKITIADPAGTIQQEIDGGATRKDIAMTYALLLRNQIGDVPWGEVNSAIVARWSPSGLLWIKERAWSYVEGRRGYGS